MQGRVEICLNGVWGTVCDEQFDSTEAQVVCAQLNYQTTGQCAKMLITFLILDTILNVLSLKKFNVVL